MTVSTSTALRAHRVAEETFVIPWELEAPPVGYFPMNSLVIRGAEPVIVDTGAPACRSEWLDAVWDVVDPLDVKWVFLSHDDRDHSGNLLQVLDACPNATLLTSWFAVGRMFEEWETPLPRCRFVNDGESIDVGDRTLVAKRPPVFDNPTTRGLFDPKTRVYWSVDTFATNMPTPLRESGDLADDAFADGQLMGSRLVAPWHEYLDDAKWQRCVDGLQSLQVDVIAGCHTPVIRGDRVGQAFDVLRRLPGLQPWQEFTQADLEMWLGAAEAIPAQTPAHDSASV